MTKRIPPFKGIERAPELPREGLRFERGSVLPRLVRKPFDPRRGQIVAED